MTEEDTSSSHPATGEQMLWKMGKYSILLENQFLFIEYHPSNSQEEKKAFPKIPGKQDQDNVVLTKSPN